MDLTNHSERTLVVIMYERVSQSNISYLFCKIIVNSLTALTKSVHYSKIRFTFSLSHRAFWFRFPCIMTDNLVVFNKLCHHTVNYHVHCEQIFLMPSLFSQ